jgi:hypothetical protein
MSLFVSIAQEAETKTSLIEVPNSKFTLDVHYGFGYRTAKIHSSLSGAEYDLAKQSKKGSSFAIEAGYILHDGLSLGITYSRFASSPSVSYYILSDDDGNPITGTLSAPNRITFVGPNANYRYIVLNNRAELRAGIGMGVLTFSGSTNLASVNLGKIKGSAFGMDLSSSFHYMITPRISIGARVGMLLGTLTKYKQTVVGQGTETVKLKGEEKESLSRLDISGGLRFYL